MRKIVRLFLIFLFPLISFFYLSNAKIIYANEKYVTVVNPIRSRELWSDTTLKPLNDQYQTINNLKLKATWLIQNDVTQDQDLIKRIKEFNSDQEFGLFLEISPNLAQKARVYYPTQTTWYSPKAIFLSAYNIDDRKKLINQMVFDFKNTFGYLPKSAGAWWIDSWSQQYLEKKYHITTIMICSDQKTTDQYGIWGQWWGYPYHPSPNNILVPGNSKTVVIQWAQRDLEKAYYGTGPSVSNYSLQANDYTSQGLDIKYFQNLATQYLSVEKLGQITIGLETGMESIGNEAEYQKQLTWLSQNQITSLTMSEFGNKYRSVYENKNPGKIILGDWILTKEYRENNKLGETTIYHPNISFSDKFVADKSDFLNRVLPQNNNIVNQKYFPIFLIFIPILFFLTKNFSTILFTLILYLPIFRSFYSSGWKVFFGPVLNNLIFWQTLILVIFAFLFHKINKKIKIHWSSWTSVWIFNLIIFTARYSVIDGQRYFGWLIDNFRFIGITIGGGVKFINQDLVGYIAATMLKFDSKWVWNNWWVWIIIYPVIEIILVLLINKFIPKKFRYFLAIPSILFVFYIFNQNPLLVN